MDQTSEVAGLPGIGNKQGCFALSYVGTRSYVQHNYSASHDLHECSRQPRGGFIGLDGTTGGQLGRQPLGWAPRDASLVHRYTSEQPAVCGEWPIVALTDGRTCGGNRCC